MASPGFVFGLLLTGVLWAGLGAWTLADGESLGGALRLLVATFWLAFAVHVMQRKRRQRTGDKA